MRYVAAAAVAVVLGGVALWWCAGSRGERANHATGPATGSAAAGTRKRVDPETLPKAAIAGTIVVEAGGAPIAGARVCARPATSRMDSPPSCAGANERGAYAIRELVSGTYVVSAAADRFRPAMFGTLDTFQLALGPGERRTGIDIALRDGGVELAGTVVDVTGGPIAKAAVRAEASSWGGRDRPFAVSETDASGRFRLWIAPGAARVYASAPGYAELSVAAHAPATLELALTPGSSLAGTVVDGPTGAPVAGAHVAANAIDYSDRGTAISDAAGRFRIDGLSPGRYELDAHTEQGVGTSTGSVLVGLGQDVDAIVVTSWPAHRIEGRVMVSSTKGSCQGAQVLFRDVAGDRYEWAEQSPGGTLTADGMRSGTYKVEVTCQRYLTRKSYPDVAIADRDVVGVVWEVDPGATIRGHVTIADGAPADDAAVVAEGVSPEPSDIQNRWKRSVVDRTGRYELTGLAPGKYSIVAAGGDDRGSREDFEKGVEVDVPAGATIERDFTIALGTISGVVVDPDGRPQRDVTVVVFGPTNTQTTSDVSGRFSSLVTPGEYRVATRDEALGALRSRADIRKVGVAVTVATARTSDVRVVAKSAAGSISGVVFDTDGRPLADAYVYVAEVGNPGGQRVAWDDRDPPVLTSPDGTFTLGRLAPGSYSVHAYRKGGGEAAADNVAVGARVKLRLSRAATLEGVVRHVGKPIIDLGIEVGDPRTWMRRREHFFHSEGRFAIRDLAAGRHHVTILADGMQSALDVELADGETKTVAIEVASDVTLTGRVVELGTTKPVPGVNVAAKLAGPDSMLIGPDDPHGTTDASGRFAIAHVPVGTLSVSGSVAGGGGFSISRAIAGTGTVDLGDLALVPLRVKERERPGNPGFKLASSLTWAIATHRELRVTEIDPAGPAAGSGLRVGDTITSVDGHDVRGENVYVAELLRAPPGSKLVLGVERGATVAITLAAPPSLLDE